MARTGIYFSDVKRARDALVSRGRHPSIDAVRAELGNTGSKTTIHKFLREIEETEGSAQRPLSEAIGTLVNQLAIQLKAEADETVLVLKGEPSEERIERDKDRANFGSRLGEAKDAYDTLVNQMKALQHQFEQLGEQLHKEQIARHTAEQRSRDLAERLEDASRHCASLEEKHRQAREALEHFRIAAKEQREQENRRHEFQVQSLQADVRQTQQAAALKQEELIKLNRDAASLTKDVAGAKHALHLEQENSRSLKRRLEQLQMVELRLAALEVQATESQARCAAVDQALANATKLNGALQRQIVTLENELAAVRSTTAFEQRIRELQQAVFGQPGDSSSAENSK